MIVRITTADEGEVRTAGCLRLDGATIHIEPATPEDRRLLENILKAPILVDVAGKTSYIHANREPRKFLKNLCHEYKSAYLRASRAEAE